MPSVVGEPDSVNNIVDGHLLHSIPAAMFRAGARVVCDKDVSEITPHQTTGGGWGCRYCDRRSTGCHSRCRRGGRPGSGHHSNHFPRHRTARRQRLRQQRQLRIRRGQRWPRRRTGRPRLHPRRRLRLRRPVLRTRWRAGRPGLHPRRRLRLRPRITSRANRQRPGSLVIQARDSAGSITSSSSNVVADRSALPCW